MAIGTNDAIYKFGTQDEVTSGTPATISSGAFGKADQGASVNWTNDDDAPLGAAVLKAQFDTTMPTEGQIDLYARLLNVQGANDAQVPASDNRAVFCGTFVIPEGVSADTDFYATVDEFRMPAVGSSQAIDWYLHNNGTGRTLGVSWQLWITPKGFGPHA